jgi:hypothetical protein
MSGKHVISFLITKLALNIGTCRAPYRIQATCRVRDSISVAGHSILKISAFKLKVNAFTTSLGVPFLFCKFPIPISSLIISIMASVFNINTAREKFPALRQNQVYFDNAGGSQTLGAVIES